MISTFNCLLIIYDFMWKNSEHANACFSFCKVVLLVLTIFFWWCYNVITNRVRSLLIMFIICLTALINILMITNFFKKSYHTISKITYGRRILRRWTAKVPMNHWMQTCICPPVNQFEIIFYQSIIKDKIYTIFEGVFQIWSTLLGDNNEWVCV